MRCGKWGPAVLHPSSPGCSYYVRCKQVGSEVPGQDCPLFLDSTHPERGQTDQLAAEEETLLAVDSTHLARQAGASNGAP